MMRGGAKEEVMIVNQSSGKEPEGEYILIIVCQTLLVKTETPSASKEGAGKGGMEMEAWRTQL